MIGQAIDGDVYRNMGFYFDYGFSQAVYLATFDTACTFQYMIIHIILALATSAL